MKIKNNPVLFKQTWVALQDNRPITVPRVFIDLLQSTKAAVLLAQMIYWTRQGCFIEKNNGWFFKNAVTWQEETGLSLQEQRTARKHLLSAGLISEERKGMPAKLYTKVNLDVLQAKLLPFKDIKPEWICLGGLREKEVRTTSIFGKATMYHRDLALLTGGVNSGLMLSVMMHQASLLGRRNREEHIATVKIGMAKWTDLTGLSYFEQKRAREKLKKLGLVKELHLDTSNSIFSMVNLTKLKELLVKNTQKKLAKKQHYADKQFPDNYRKPFLSIVENKKENIYYNHSFNEKADELFSEKNNFNKQVCWNSNYSLLKVKIQTVETENPLYINVCAKSNTKPKINTTTSNNEGNLKMTEGKTEAAVFASLEKPLTPTLQSRESNYIWPNCFGPTSKPTAIRCLQKIAVGDGQVILDEIAGNYQLGKIRNVLAYLRTLVDQALVNEFMPSDSAIKVLMNRQTKQKQREIQLAKEKEVVNTEENKGQNGRIAFLKMMVEKNPHDQKYKDSLELALLNA